jgi:hypothetical protein
MDFKVGTRSSSRVKMKMAREASLLVNPAEDVLHLVICYFLICNLLQTYGSFCKR